MVSRYENIGQNCGALTHVAEQIPTGFIPLELHNISSRVVERMKNFLQGTLMLCLVQKVGSISLTSSQDQNSDFSLLFLITITAA